MEFFPLQNFFFVLPWALLGLLLLPILWWLLRVTPPQPVEIWFPAVRFIEGIETENARAAKTPWWLLLVRVIITALIILAFSEPVYAPEEEVASDQPILVVIDNDWSSALAWNKRQQVFETILTRATRYRQDVYLLAGADAGSDGEAPVVIGPLSSGQARGYLENLKPRAWNLNRAAMLSSLEEASKRIPDNLEVFWLGSSVANPGDSYFVEALGEIGAVSLFQEKQEEWPSRLVAPVTTGNQISINAQRLGGNGEEEMVVAAFDKQGMLISDAMVSFLDNVQEVTANFDLPLVLRNRISYFSLPGSPSAASTYVVDGEWQRRPVGILSREKFSSAAALLTSRFYLQSAMNPFAEVYAGNPEQLLSKSLSVIFWTDDVVLDDRERELLMNWVLRGGYLVRFAGPNLLRSQNQDLLLPVRLRQSSRLLGGVMTWEKPASIDAFTSQGPFTVLEPDQSIRIYRQVLAVPSLELPDRTWAKLEDGTPIVTADARGEGQVVLFHTSGNPAWSDLSLSGQFVDLLRLVVQSSKGQRVQGDSQVLDPWLFVGSDGQLGNPGVEARALILETEVPLASSESPPGLYGSPDQAVAINLIDALGDFEPLFVEDSAVTKLPYDEREQLELKPWLLLAAIALLLLDLIVRFAFQGLLRKANRQKVAGVLCLVLTFLVVNSDKASAQESNIDSMVNTRLAWVKTGVEEVDATNKAGLFGLSVHVVNRTSIELRIPKGINLDTDELSPFPLIYWSVTPDQKLLSDATASKVNAYLRGGGLVLFDTGDASSSETGRSGSSKALKNLVENLEIPPLERVTGNHVLGKAFFLLDGFPGRWSGADVWAGKQPGDDSVFGDARVNDNVSSIVIGSHDWVGAWALNEATQPIFPVVPGGERQRELAFRFGINLVMYTLAGNYKADQVHIPSILKRLDENRALQE